MNSPVYRDHAIILVATSGILRVGLTGIVSLGEGEIFSSDDNRVCIRKNNRTYRVCIRRTTEHTQATVIASRN